MKKLLCCFLLLSSFQSFSQHNLPIVRANSNKAKIWQEQAHVRGWSIQPKNALDIFTTNKLTQATTIKFVTDVDSISFKLKPGQMKDFIVLLNEKDSCLTRIKGPEIKDFSKAKPAFRDSIPLLINAQNTIYVNGILNERDTLNLNFDSGTTELVLKNDVLKDKVKSKLKLYDTLYGLALGKRIYRAKVYDTVLSGHDTDGRFGWDLFDGMVVEINYERMLLIIHSAIPEGLRKDNSYSKLKLKYDKDLFFVKATISQAEVKNEDWFLFDTGYQRTAMLDNDQLKKNSFPVEKMEVIKKVMLHGASGNEVPVITSNLESLKIGNHELKNVPIQLLTTNKPMRDAEIHILGNEVLKRFNVVIDFQKNVVYMKPNSKFTDEYIENKKS